jgi:hypothetical protein
LQNCNKNPLGKKGPFISDWVKGSANPKQRLARHLLSDQHRLSSAKAPQNASEKIEPKRELLTRNLTKRGLWVAMSVLNGLSVSVMSRIIRTGHRTGCYDDSLITGQLQFRSNLLFVLLYNVRYVSSSNVASSVQLSLVQV